MKKTDELFHIIILFVLCEHIKTYQILFVYVDYF